MKCLSVSGQTKLRLQKGNEQSTSLISRFQFICQVKLVLTMESLFLYFKMNSKLVKVARLTAQKGEFICIFMEQILFMKQHQYWRYYQKVHSGFSVKIQLLHNQLWDTNMENTATSGLLCTSDTSNSTSFIVFYSLLLYSFVYMNPFLVIFLCFHLTTHFVRSIEIMFCHFTHTQFATFFLLFCFQYDFQCSNVCPSNFKATQQYVLLMVQLAKT